MKYTEELSFTVSRKRKANKKRLTAPLQKLIVEACDYKSIVIIPDSLKRILEKLGEIEMVASSHPKKHNRSREANEYYVIRDSEIALLRVRKNFWKVIPAEMCQWLAENFHFRYYKSGLTGMWFADAPYYGDVTENGEKVSVIKYGKVVSIERIIDDYWNTGKFDRTKLVKKSIHHKWFRFSALPSMIKSLYPEDHGFFHGIIGNYARNQCIIIEDEEEFKQFKNVVIRYDKELREKRFSLEF